MKSTVEGINSRIMEAENQISEAENRISEVEDRVVEITATEKNKEKRMKKTEESLIDLWDNIKYTKILITGVPGEEIEKGPEKIFEEIITENFPNMGKETVTQVEKVQRIPYKINPRRNTARHILNKLTKIKFKEKTASRESNK